MGALAVTLGLNPKRALLNDFNPHLVNFFKQLQQGLEITLEFKHDKDEFYEARKQFNQLISNNEYENPEAAQLFYYLNRTCFNGLCRFNNSGEFNVPFGAYKSINYATTKDFAKYKPVMKNWKINKPGDFSKLKPTKNDIVYADPPYDAGFTTYSQGGFNWDDQQRLAQFLADAPCTVIASNLATERIVELYKSHGFEVKEIQAPRRISRTGDRTPVNEMMATINR
jgi:DNA adenine methylase